MDIEIYIFRGSYAKQARPDFITHTYKTGIELHYYVSQSWIWARFVNAASV